MNKLGKYVRGFLLLIVTAMTVNANAAVLVEDFEGPFPAWESGWLGTNSNLQNIYGVGAGRGNNPDGLWIFDGSNSNNGAVINFNSLFGSTISQFSIDVTTWVQGAVFHAFDMNGNELANVAITSFFGGYSNPGSYQTISFSSANGVAGFSIVGGGIEGNTSIDNVVVTTGSTDVPEPASLGLLGLGLALIAMRRKAKA